MKVADVTGVAWQQMCVSSWQVFGCFASTGVTDGPARASDFLSVFFLFFLRSLFIALSVKQPMPLNT